MTSRLNLAGKNSKKSDSKKKEGLSTCDSSQADIPKRRGRPSRRSPEIIDEIIERLSTGEPLRQICRDEHMPHWNTVYDWTDADAELSGRIARARDKGEEAILQQCLEIADQPPPLTAMGSTDSGAVQHQKLRIETRLKLLAKWNPRKWGEKVDLNHGVQPENPLATLLQRVAGTGLPVVKDEPDDERAD